ncbi:zincin-like metallopeptidase domain-containing protein [Hyphomicrobiales bacterium 4NK60-0047b]
MAKRDIYQEITNKIIKRLDYVDLENFKAPFAELAAQGMPLNPITGKSYNGINIPSLWIDQQEKSFNSPEWASYKQWKEAGAQVRKGEQGSLIVFYKTWNKQEEDEQGEQQDIQIPVMRLYTVFNANQVEGYESEDTLSLAQTHLVTRIESADAFAQKTGANIKHGEARAYYNRTNDFINMPQTSAFLDTAHSSATENYYSVLFHELTHWTGAPHRLNRDKATSKTHNLEKYAFEELIAELGAAFLCAQLEIVQSPRDDHARYLKCWLQALHGDKSFIFKASAQAAKAIEFLNSFQD